VLGYQVVTFSSCRGLSFYLQDSRGLETGEKFVSLYIDGGMRIAAEAGQGFWIAD